MSPGDRAQGRGGSKNGASACEKAIPTIKNSSALVREPIMRLTSGFDPRVETCIVEMRLSPPEHLGRTPGPRALLYYLPRDPALQAAGVRLPRSSRTVWKLLRKTGCILPKLQRKRWRTSPREPLEEIQMDAQRCE